MNPPRATATDLIRELGSMTFASRLKRLGDRLKAEATRSYHEHGIEFNDSWFLVALVLSQREPVSITEAADALGVSHPAIIQMSTAMARKGLVRVEADPQDLRRRLLLLTDKGRKTVEALQPIWKAVGDCTDDMIAAAGGAGLLDIIAAIETQMEQQGLVERVKARLEEETNRA